MGLTILTPVKFLSLPLGKRIKHPFGHLHSSTIIHLWCSSNIFSNMKKVLEKDTEKDEDIEENLFCFEFN
jgi:hypothetical protein